ncbi:type II toxin-antitoxin system Phd/YefM family antitoxin [Sphingobium salicis]|uniref:type II toxin-antitoxin system Phd/YefM family antitoxin n=1 Tax=unclassified Sphingobium TaxID=2611147 RepID=UPI0009E59D2B
MDRAISASEANQHFSELLREVSEGASFTVMSRRRPVARVMPVDRHQDKQSTQKMLAFAAGLSVRNSGGAGRATICTNDPRSCGQQHPRLPCRRKPRGPRMKPKSRKRAN